MFSLSRLITWLLGIAVTLIGIALVVIAAASTQLPPVDQLSDYRPKVPLRVFSADGVLIGEFGEERRSRVHLSQVPSHLKNAILAAEDDGFYEHMGIDIRGIVRSLFNNIATGRRAQGASTITMQVARNFYLSSEKTLTRKLYEVLLAFEIERTLTKDEILELYINQIFLGRRAYGFGAAARTYFNKPIEQLTLAESAMLAGLPKAPSAFNPISNPKRAKARQEYILSRMHDLEMINSAQLSAAKSEQVLASSKASIRLASPPAEAAFVAEMVRIAMVERFSEEAYTRGLSVFTTIRWPEQKAASAALQKGLVDFDSRRGWRGPEHFQAIATSLSGEALEDAVQAALDERTTIAGFIPAVVLEASPKAVEAMLADGTRVALEEKALTIGASGLSSKAAAAKAIRRGSVIRLRRSDDGTYSLAQIPLVEGALVSLDAFDGSIRALAGGFDFRTNKFNHATQAYRQPGSSIKPFVYAAALERGYSATTLVDDSPLRFDAIRTGGEIWEPKNYDNTYDGLIPLWDALARSKNMVSIRLVEALSPAYVQSFVSRFGLESSRNPAFLTISLGAGSATPLQMANAFAVFSNGGYRVTPRLIDRIVDEDGRVLEKTPRTAVGENAPRVLDETTAYMSHELLQTVITRGTGRKALSLGRSDLAGKTGTTNDAQDAWFVGTGGGLAAAVWVGYDQPQSLGARETGGGLALPVWMDYMKVALQDAPERRPTKPEGLTTIDGFSYTEANAPGVGIRQLGGESAFESFLESLGIGGGASQKGAPDDEGPF